MGAFVQTSRSEPPALRTVLARAGGAVYFACRSHWWGWSMLSNGRETSIPAPAEWWDDSVPQSEMFYKEHSALTGQMLLEFGRAA